MNMNRNGMSVLDKADSLLNSNSLQDYILIDETVYR